MLLNDGFAWRRPREIRVQEPVAFPQPRGIFIATPWQYNCDLMNATTRHSIYFPSGQAQEIMIIQYISNKCSTNCKYESLILVCST